MSHEHIRLLPRNVALVLAAVGLVAVNGPFVFLVVDRPEVFWGALHNPIAVAFMVEAGLIMSIAAWLIWRNRPTAMGWRAFVALSVAGSLAFSVPLLLSERRRRPGSGERGAERLAATDLAGQGGEQVGEQRAHAPF